MKIEVKENTLFQPIELKLVIETEQQLCDLWHRLNVASGAINRHSDRLKYDANEKNYDLFAILDDLVIKYNLEDEAE